MLAAGDSDPPASSIRSKNLETCKTPDLPLPPLPTAKKVSAAVVLRYYYMRYYPGDDDAGFLDTKAHRKTVRNQKKITLQTSVATGRRGGERGEECISHFPDLEKKTND